MVEIDIQVSIDLDDGQHLTIDKATAIELRDQLLAAFPIESVALAVNEPWLYPSYYPSPVLPVWPTIVSCNDVGDPEKTSKQIAQSLGGR